MNANRSGIQRFIFWLPTYKKTGGNLIANLYAQLLLNKNYDVSILVLSEKNKDIPEFWDKRIKFIFIKTFIKQKIYVLFFMTPLLFHYRKISKLISRSDKIISIYSPISFVILIFQIMGKIQKSFFILHDNPTQKWTGLFSFKIFIPLYIRFHKGSSIAFVNKLLQAHILFCKNRAILEIPNALTAYFDSNFKLFEQKKFQIVYIGDVTKSKGFDVLVKEIKILKDKIPNIKIICFFSKRGSNDNLLNSLFDEYYIAADQKTIAYTLKDSQFLICTSPSESFCLPVLEAMSSGCLVVTTKTIGTSRYIKNGENGFFFNSKIKGDAYNVFNKIILLENTKKKNISKQAYETAKIFSLESMKKNFFRFLNI